MGIHEKLVELIGEAQRPYAQNGYCYFRGLSAIVDYLIANGVTIQEWVPVTQRRPDEELDVIRAAYSYAYKCFIVIRSCVDPTRTYIDRGYYESSNDGSKWRFLDSNTIDVSDRVTHWMPMPAKPKPIKIIYGGGGGGA